MNELPKNEGVDFSEVPAKLRRKMISYHQHLIKKHPVWSLPQIRERVAKKFNIKFVE
jgi:hypothetical protein